MEVHNQARFIEGTSATANIDIIHNLVAYVRTHAHACIDTLIYICLYIKNMNNIDITHKYTDDNSFFCPNKQGNVLIFNQKLLLQTWEN